MMLCNRRIRFLVPTSSAMDQPKGSMTASYQDIPAITGSHVTPVKCRLSKVLVICPIWRDLMRKRTAALRQQATLTFSRPQGQVV